MLRILQVTHLVLVALAYILWVVFSATTSPDDMDRPMIDIVYLVFSSVAVMVVLLVEVLRDHGNSRAFIIRSYRHLLVRPIFLIPSNILLASIIIYLSYHFIFYQAYNLYSNEDGTLYLHGDPPKSLGKIEKGKTLTRRFPNGIVRLYVQSLPNPREVRSQRIDTNDTNEKTISFTFNNP